MPDLVRVVEEGMWGWMWMVGDGVYLIHGGRMERHFSELFTVMEEAALRGRLRGRVLFHAGRPLGVDCAGGSFFIPVGFIYTGRLHLEGPSLYR